MGAGRWERGTGGEVRIFQARESVVMGDAKPSPTPSSWGIHATIEDVRLLRNLDSNRDNRLGRREWTGSAARFHRLDRNADGVLSPRELSRN
jgi:hypothetical protein